MQFPSISAPSSELVGHVCSFCGPRPITDFKEAFSGLANLANLFRRTGGSPLWGPKVLIPTSSPKKETGRMVCTDTSCRSDLVGWSARTSASAQLLSGGRSEQPDRMISIRMFRLPSVEVWWMFGGTLVDHDHPGGSLGSARTRVDRLHAMHVRFRLCKSLPHAKTLLGASLR